jgi:hypothetical protein
LVCLIDEWAPTSFFGIIYLTLITTSILTQINTSQFITIRIPHKLGIFDSDTMQNMKIGLLKGFASKSIILGIQNEDDANQLLH